MTKEELEKEALAKYKTGSYPQLHPDHFAFIHGYITGVEPREKRIADLESTNKKISDECHKLVDTLEKKQNKNELLETQNIKLQAEVSKLTIKNADLIGKIAFTENALNNAKAQIEKMKNWCNCKNYQQCLIELAEQGKGMKPSECCVNCKKWEIKK